MNLTYLNVTLTGKVLLWKRYLQDKDFHLFQVPGKEVYQRIPDAESRLCKWSYEQLPMVQRIMNTVENMTYGSPSTLSTPMCSSHRGED